MQGSHSFHLLKYDAGPCSRAKAISRMGESKFSRKPNLALVKYPECWVIAQMSAAAPPDSGVGHSQMFSRGNRIGHLILRAAISKVSPSANLAK
jgi:hypothetical protein